MRERLVRAVVVGYQGFGNLGDEAILAGIEDLLAEQGVDVTTVIGGPAPIAAFPSARRIVSRRLLPGPGAVRALARADVLLLAGGGLLHDHFRMTIPRYLSWVVAARAARCRVVWVGVGIGPLRRTMSRRLVGLALRLSHAVFVRDAGSSALAREVGGRVDGVMPDPALLLAAPDPGPASDEILVIVRPPIGGTDAGRMMERSLVELLADLAIAGRPARILTFAGDRDRAFATTIAAAVARSAPPPPIEDVAPDPRAALGRIARCRLVVSVRLHGMILAAVAGRPFVAVAYDPKVRGIAAELDAADLVVEPGTLASGVLQAAVDRALEPPRRERVAARLAEMRMGSAETSNRVGRAVRGDS